MFSLENTKHRLVSNQMTYAEDGPVCIEQSSLMTFISRALLQMNSSALRQLPNNWQVDIDTDMFLKSISFHNTKTDERETIGSWSQAPKVNSDVIAPSTRNFIIFTYILIYIYRSRCN